MKHEAPWSKIDLKSPYLAAAVKVFVKKKKKGINNSFSDQFGIMELPSSCDIAL